MSTQDFVVNYGVVTGRVVANGGFGLPNVNVSVFVPLEEIDENDPVISTLYPYKTPQDKNEDGYRYNLLPYRKENNNTYRQEHFRIEKMY